MSLITRIWSYFWKRNKIPTSPFSLVSEISFACGEQGEHQGADCVSTVPALALVRADTLAGGGTSSATRIGFMPARSSTAQEEFYSWPFPTGICPLCSTWVPPSEQIILVHWNWYNCRCSCYLYKCLLSLNSTKLLASRISRSNEL